MTLSTLSRNLNRVMSPDVLHCRSGKRQSTEFKKHIQKAYFHANIDIFFLNSRLAPS
jgi:hypothetical protein